MKTKKCSSFGSNMLPLIVYMFHVFNDLSMAFTCKYNAVLQVADSCVCCGVSDEDHGGV